MKKLPAFLNTPARIAIAVGLAVLVVELLIMLLIENIRATMRKGHFLENVDWEFADPILLTIIIAPALYFLIFRTLNQQTELERQLDKMRLFQNVTVGRELRMRELMKEIAALRNSLSTKPADDLSTTGGSTKAALEATTHLTTGQPAEDEDSQRDALLFMLEDLENARRKITQAHQEWIVALDTLEDPIFLHDKEFRILRCNKAYQQRAGMTFKQIIGQPYYEVFPKNHGPLSSCIGAMEKAEEEEEEEEEEVTVGGAIYRSRAFSIHDEHGDHLYSMHILEDITESHRAKAALRESEARFSAIAGAAGDLIFSINADGEVGFVNEAAARALHSTPEQVIGKPLRDLFPAETFESYWRDLQKVFESGEPLYAEAPAHFPHGSEIWLGTWLVPLRDAGGNVAAVMGDARDITGRKQAEETFHLMVSSLAQNVGAEFFQDTVRELCAWLGTDSVIIGEMVEGDRVRSLAMQLDGKAIEHYEYALPGTPCNSLAHKGYCEYPEGVCQLFPDDKDLIDMGAEAYVGTPVRNRDGEPVGILCAISRRKLALPGKAREVMEMIAVRAGMEIERKQAEESLKKNGALLSEMGRMTKAGGWEFDARTGQGTWTEEVARIHEMKPQEQTSREIGLGFYQGESRRKIEAAISEAIANGTPYDLELEMVTAKGNHKWVRTIAQPIHDGGKVVKVRGSFQDITERKLAEAAIQHANRALAALGMVNRGLVHATNEGELLHAVCDAIVEQRGYLMAWVGYVQHDEGKTIEIMAHAGPEGYLETMQLTWAETERGMAPSGRAIRSGATQLCQDIANDPQYLPWRAEALKRGLASNIALPLKNSDDAVFGILHVYAGEMNAFTTAEVDLLEEMAGDLAFGVRALHIRQERDLALAKNQQQLAQLQDSLEGTVRAIASMVEMRDPYTAGHQAKVADLAVAIARQMELPDEQVHAIHLAGLVHDLGKIQVPAEILSKPGKLTDIEFSLIKVHPQAGYDILKGIDFPWPIAQMVLQHHERLDGTGYPQGLKGDAILLEARILAVADVVEAISAHRPYRAGLGIEVALGEIAKNRGKYYDPQVVDVCLALFREQHYSFKS